MVGVWQQIWSSGQMVCTTPWATVLGKTALIEDLGIRSKTRRAVIHGKEIETTVPTPNCAFRVTIPAEAMNADEELKHLLAEEDANGWFGPRCHIMAYPIRRGEMYNLVLCHQGEPVPGKGNEPGDPDEMRAHYSHFDPVIQKILTKVKSCLKWKLADLPPLPSWVSPSGRVVLIGDAAHAMLPYLAQVSSDLSVAWYIKQLTAQKGRCDGNRGRGCTWRMSR